MIPPVQVTKKILHSIDTLLATVILIAVWKSASALIGKEIILPAPEQVLIGFSTFLTSSRFYQALAATAIRGISAFFIAMLLGSLNGFFCGLSERFERMLQPLMLVIRATPVLAIILLAMIWFPAGSVPVFSAVIMSFPLVATEICAGVKSVDPKLVAMARLFRVPWWRITWSIRIPNALPHILAAARNALGLSWKVVIAGEVLSQPNHAIGSGMQNARIMLETTEVFAWAAAGILLCAVSDWLFDLAIRRTSGMGRWI